MKRDLFHNHTHGFTNTHSILRNRPESLYRSTSLPAIYISSFWQQTPISNFTGKAGPYHWPWYMALLVVTKAHSFSGHHCFHRNIIIAFSKRQQLEDIKKKKKAAQTTRSVVSQCNSLMGVSTSWEKKSTKYTLF